MSAQPQGPKPEPEPMETEPESNITEVDLRANSNNVLHNTNEFTTAQLIVRRGQSFSICLKFKEMYKPKTHNLTFTASTGDFADEKRGTKSRFGIPDTVKRSPKAKAVWKAEIGKKESTDPEEGWVFINITPPADAPVGIYTLSLNFLKEDKQLGTLALLFNPWCTEDSVYMEKKKARQEYVMNENGIIYKGSAHFLFPSPWSFAQFEADMVEIIFHLLHLNPNNIEDPAKDEGAWSDPGYVGRVISAMINSEDDQGVLEGRWSGGYAGGRPPTHWNDSHTILSQWRESGYKPVKYGQCWVFAAVMCSVLRALGIPCRVISNFQSAHDTDMNLLIDEYRTEYGVPEIDSYDSVWNFHVWVEGWMRRPDLPEGFDGWQVLDPTPQELSGGVFQCGPAPVKAIRNGNTDLKYDIPFVFAEVNADCVIWKVKADGSKTRTYTDTNHVGVNTSTKSIGSNKRKNVTLKYKHKEGSKKERDVFKYAVDCIDYSENDGDFDSEESEEETDDDNETVEPEPPAELPKVSVKFENVSEMVNGNDVKLNLKLHSEATEPRPLSINIKVIAKSYTGSEHTDIQAEVKQDTLLPKKDLVIPVVVPFSKYWKPMLDHDVMRVTAMVSDIDNSSDVFLVEKDVVLADPPMEIELLSEALLYRPTYLQIIFKNPVPETLKDCTLSLSGSGLLRKEEEFSLPILPGKRRLRVKLYFFPYKLGEKTMVADFNCSVFRDIKKSIKIHVK